MRDDARVSWGTGMACGPSGGRPGGKMPFAVSWSESFPEDRRRQPGIRAGILAVCCPEGALPPQTACAVGEPAVAQVPGSMRGHPGTAVSGCWRYLAAWPGGGILWRCPPVVRRYGHMETGRSSALLPPVMTCSAAPAAGAAAEHAVQRGGGGTSRWTGLPSPGPGRCRVGAPWGGGRPFPGGKITACW